MPPLEAALRLLACFVGVGLVGLVVWDALLTLLHPTARGRLSYAANRATWKVVRTFSLKLGGRRLSYAGPLAVTINVAAWVLLLWLGFALIYLPFMDSFRFDPEAARAGQQGLLEALYVSGTVLTTMGLSDAAVASDAMRLVVILEAGSGFGAFSAAIAFVLSVYPLLTDLRATGLQLADLGVLELEGAARVVNEAGADEMPSLVRELTESHEQLKRFPVLYFFESGNREESLSALVRGSALLLVALRCVPAEAFPQSGVYAKTMEHILDRLVGDLNADFVGGRRQNGAGTSESDEGAYDIARLCARAFPDAVMQEWDPATRRELAALLGRADAVLAAVAEEHGHRHEPLFPEDS